MVYMASAHDLSQLDLEIFHKAGLEEFWFASCWVFLSSPQKHIGKRFKKNISSGSSPGACWAQYLSFFSFIAYANLPISAVYFLLYSATIVSGFLSGKILFKEKINLIKLISLVLIFFAIYLIYSCVVQTNQLVFVLFALMAGLASGLWNTLSKKFSSFYSSFQLAFVDAFVCFVICLLLSLCFKEPLPQLVPSSPWLWIILFSLITVATVNLSIYGFRQVEAQLGTIIMPLQIMFGSFFGWLILKEALSLATILGGIMIFIGATLPSISQDFFQKHSRSHRH